MSSLNVVSTPSETHGLPIWLTMLQDFPKTDTGLERFLARENARTHARVVYGQWLHFAATEQEMLDAARALIKAEWEFHNGN